MRDCGFVTATVTGERHADMLQNRIIPSLADKHLLERTIFMQGGAPPHIARRVKDLLRRSFESNSTVPKNSADEKNCADGAKLCTNETEPSASERKIKLGGGDCEGDATVTEDVDGRRRRIPFDFQRTSLIGLAQIRQPVVASGEPQALQCKTGPHPGTTWNYKTGGIIHQLMIKPGHAG
ncbi:uncharacterized protein TNCV_2621961 [Trichonephila clavipes]|uniref:Uncharacterized protein n=1 Tax=Trichonephila clavipes TaxID=2585209 RepID=A0A8X7BIV7_TRICX|nr:uncharacterized protein TNCV_2621961 [Trichonephila clavipes]